MAQTNKVEEIPASVIRIGSITMLGKPGARWTCPYCGTKNEIAPKSSNIHAGGDIVGGDKTTVIIR